ncbi:MAG: hypothetical protein GF393_01895 [Armatimonadia bacterium]|nr:hypothetical protein [Armatimonadia bacterium]
MGEVRAGTCARRGRSVGRRPEVSAMRAGRALALIASLLCVCLVADAQSGPVAYYSFDDCDGRTVRDQSGHGHDGTVAGATVVDSPWGRALLFDGDDDYVDLGDPPALRMDGDMSVECWVRGDISGKQPRDRENGNWLFIGDSSNLTIHRNWNLRVDTYNELRFEWGNDLDYTELGREAAFLDGQWHHVAAIAESPQRVYIHVDGQVFARSEMVLPITATEGGSFRIGGWFAGVFPGEIDEVRVYDRAISSAEVREHAGIEQPRPTLSVDAAYSYPREAFVVRIFAEDTAARAEGISVRIADPEAREIISRKLPAAEQTRPGSGRWWVDLLLPHTPVQAGDYALRCAITGADGRALAVETEAVPCIERPWWLDAEVGISREVPPPFEPLRTETTERAVEVLPWNRRIAFGERPFVSAIDSAGETILARPMTLEIETADGPLAIGSDAPRVREAADDRVLLERESTAGPLRLREDWRVEYDGFARFDWSLRADEPTTVARMALEIPLRAEVAKYFHGWPGRNDVTVTEAIALPFQAIAFLGDEDRGLCWVAESPQDWSLADPARAVEVIPGDEETVIRLNIITEPVALATDDALEYEFGLLTMPVRPMERTMWERRIQRAKPYANEYAWMEMEIDGKPALERFAELGVGGFNIWRWWDVFSYTLPIGHEQRFPELVAAMHEHDLQLSPYAIGMLFGTRAPEYPYFAEDFLMVPRREWFIDRLPGLENQMTYMGCTRSPWQDWAVATSAQCMDEYDTDGVYLDTTTRPLACRNTLHGCGYTRSDGTVAANHPIFANRRLMKRLYTMVLERKRDGLVDLHASGCYNAVSMAFATDYWNGEHLPRAERMTDTLPLDVFRAQYMGRNLGVPADFLYYRFGGFRRSLGLSMLHDVPTRAENIEDIRLLSEVWAVRERFECDGPEARAEFVGYWELDGLASASPEDAYVSLWRHPERGVLALVCNLGAESATVEVRFDTQALGIEEGALTLELPAEDWRLVAVQ